MDPVSLGEQAANPQLLAGLRHLGQLTGEQAARRIAQTLDFAERPGAAARDVQRIDEAVIGALRGTGQVDGVLEHLDPERLFALVGRRARALDGTTAPEARALAWEALDLMRRTSVLRRIGADRVEAWAGRILEAVDASHLTVGPLLRQRTELYGSKTLFEFSEAGARRSLSWRQVGSRVEHLARCLVGLDAGGDPSPIAILSDNRVEMALLDLACLSSGLVDVLIPANATEADVGYILRHSRARTAIVADAQQLRKVLKHRDSLPELAWVITIQAVAGQGKDVPTLDALASAAERVPAARVRARADNVRSGDLATVMYTSGTTGTPKGIQFSHRAIVFKRFARALALPEIGEHDVFLCFLPLYHTFGRFLEMLGCIFWGATYCFPESTSVEALIQGMWRYRPTVFISVPKKWIQLREAIAQLTDSLASDAELALAVRQVTGGRLRWGLSAAGYLDPEIFRFFQRQGIELLSGFGMTEATGGITMTPPGGYKDGSLGRALPGIELKLVEDGELLTRGPYMMIGYLDAPEGEPSFDDQGWFHTGDLMQMDEDGHLQLVDRKKEIFKNVKGETIAPQRIENLFRDFESVGRALLVGDHREYNTLLIHPDCDYAKTNFSTSSAQEIRDHFRSLVVSVNKFLAPYERIVDFAVIDRDLDPQRGELTPKGTPRRTAIERNFADVMRQLYRRANLVVGGVELTFPNWLFQILGLTAQDIQVGADRISLPSGGTHLTVRRQAGDRVRIGSCLYHHPQGPLNLGLLLTSPRLWLGNEELVTFLPLDTVTRQRPRSAERGIEWAGRVAPYRPREEERAAFGACIGGHELDPLDLDLAARMLASEAEQDALRAVDVIGNLLGGEEGPLSDAARLLLARMAEGPAPRELRRRAFRVLAPAERDSRFRETLARFLAQEPDLLDAETRTLLSETSLSAAKIETLIELAQEACLSEPAPGAAAGGLLDLLAAYGTVHPSRYRRLRAFLVRMSLFAPQPELRQHAALAVEQLQDGFRQWLGPTARIAVDAETGQEYRWEDVVAFEDDVPEADRIRLLSVIKHTSFLKEGVFLFSTGATILLSDIPPGGVWVRLLGARHGKSVYRITVQTWLQGSHELAANLNQELQQVQVQEEIHWLILSGDPGGRDPLVEDFGGYWPQQDLWSEEFIAGETLNRTLRRLSRQADQQERFQQLWPFLAWATLAAYVDFWHRSGRRLEIADSGMSNVIVPTEDYQAGVRIVSVSRRRPHSGLLNMMRTFREELVVAAENQYACLEKLVDWDVIFSSVLEVVGEREGAALFEEALCEGTPDGEELRGALRGYLERVRAHGFIPMRLFFAVERYRRWATLSGEATLAARALTLQELFDTYGLQRLAGVQPEIRVRFFRNTVFHDCAPGLAEGLDELIRRIRSGELRLDELIDAVDDLRDRLKPDPDEEYFLARLSYPYLRPEVSAGFVHSDLGGRRQSEIVVALEDHEGNAFRVRHALNPKEVERLHRLFVAAKLDVRFHIDHRYLVALNERGQIIAGIYYEIDEAGQSAHMEKIVVAERFRRKGVADGLMKEFFNRLRAAGVKTLTTGFFRPEYFYGFGFRIEKRYAGLVKSLEEESGDPGVKT